MGASCISGAAYLFLGSVWGQCSSQRVWWPFCSSAGWHCWAAAPTGQCSPVMPPHSGEWSCKDRWISLQSRPPLPPAGRDRKAKNLLCYEFLGDKAQKPAWDLGYRRCEPSPNKWMHWKVYCYISTVLREFLHSEKGPVFSSPLAANLQENELGVACINETIKESLESWKLSLLAQSSCQNWLNFRHPFSSPAQKRKELGWGWEEICVW